MTIATPLIALGLLWWMLRSGRMDPLPMIAVFVAGLIVAGTTIGSPLAVGARKSVATMSKSIGESLNNAVGSK